MTAQLGDTLEVLQDALERLDTVLLQNHSEVHACLFPREETWRDLLRFKLLPHLRNGGCLIVSITGGTNTGKSTILNRLVGAPISPVRYTAAATSHPLLACPPSRLEDCMSGYLISKYHPRKVERPEDILDNAVARDHFFVQVVDSISENHLYLDTPDIDSIEKDNWEVAEDIRAAGDVVIAVLTEEKYKDEKVISFYRNALAGGRIILPLMNKARKREAFAAAREQVVDFCDSVGLANNPAFVLPYDEDIDEHPVGPIHGLTEDKDLLTYLESLNIPRIKEQVYQNTLEAMVREMHPFLQRADKLSKQVHQAITDLEKHAAKSSSAYTPTPGESVGALLHEYIRKKRWRVTQYTAAAGARIVQTGKSVADRMFRRVSMEGDEVSDTERIYTQNRSMLLEQTRGLLDACVEVRKQLPKPLSNVLRHRLHDQDAVIETVIRQTLGDAEESSLFRNAMWEKLDTWWEEHPRQRKVIMGLDTFFVCAPTAVGIPISVFFGGIGAAEMLTASGYLGAGTYVYLIRTNLSAWWLSIMEPWLIEQREHYKKALESYVLTPMLHDLRELDTLLRGKELETIKRCNAQCR